MEKSESPRMSASSVRVAGVLMGDIRREPGARVKYALLFAALGRAFLLAGVYDVTLRGLPRLWNAARVFHPNASQWKARFYKNIPAFQARSRRAVDLLAREYENFDLLFQVGVMFDARWHDFPMSSIIYTDYTACLAARRPQGGRNPLPQQQKEWLALEKQAYQRASHVFTRAEFVRESIIEDYGLPPEKVSSVGGGVNFAELPDAPARNTETPTLLFIGKEFYRKGGDLLLKAFAKTRATHPAARLALVTDGPIPPGLPQEGVERIAPTYDRDFIASLYRRADVFVLPSRLETWGDVLLEAMAFGLPCVGVSGEAMDEIIVAGKTGLVVPAGNVEALSAALDQLIGDKGLRGEMGRAARQKVAETYTWDHVVARMIPQIQRLF
jgi:alpha-maltose-1-phosphate synthase